MLILIDSKSDKVTIWDNITYEHYQTVIKEIDTRYNCTLCYIELEKIES